MKAHQYIPALTVNGEPRLPVKPLLIAIVVLAAILRFAYLFELQANPMPVMVSQNKAFDQYNYVTMAVDIMQSNWLGTQHPGHSPVYSYLIAVLFTLFGPDINAVFIFQILYGVLAVYLFYRCAVLLFGNKTLGLLTAFIAACYSPFIYYECALLRESVIAYTNLTAFYFFLLALKKGKAKNFVFAGMVAALSFILRAGIMPAGVLIYVLLRGGETAGKRGRNFLLVLIGMAIVITPLTVRNHLAGFKAFTETSGPTLFWLGNSYDSPGIGLTYTPAQEALTEETQGKILKTIEVLFREIKVHPAEYKSLLARKFKMLFNGYEIPANLSYDLFKELSFVLNIAPFNFFLISPLALLGLFLIWKKFPRLGLFYVFIASLTVFVFIFHIQSRYRVAFIPFYIIAASYTIYWFWDMFRQRKRDILIAAGTAFAVLFLFTCPDQGLIKTYFDGGVRGIDYTNMANSYLVKVEREKLTGPVRKQHLEKALKFFDKALPSIPREGQAWIHLTRGMIFNDLNLKTRAFDAFAKALEIEPDNPVIQREYERAAAKLF